jgi:hypothetical protein
METIYAANEQLIDLEKNHGIALYHYECIGYSFNFEL